MQMNYPEEAIVCYICVSKNFEEENFTYRLPVLIDCKSAL